ncbi:hypothetical protein MMC20_004193 [Loxospora ochrophaea]|nr:hypothetical protein [Loxospora ochrophaea]
MKFFGLFPAIFVAFAATLILASPVELNSRDATVVDARENLNDRVVEVPPPTCVDGIDPEGQPCNPGGPELPPGKGIPLVRKAIEVPPPTCVDGIDPEGQPCNPGGPELPPGKGIPLVRKAIDGVVKRIETRSFTRVIPTGHHHPSPVSQREEKRDDSLIHKPTSGPISAVPAKVKKDTEATTVTLPTHHHFTLSPEPAKVKKDIEATTVTLPTHHHFTLSPEPEPGFFGPKRDGEVVRPKPGDPGFKGPKRSIEVASSQPRDADCPKVPGYHGQSNCFYGP